MDKINLTQAEKQFKKFARNRLPKTTYRERCSIEREDVCGGEGCTCADDDAPEDWEQVIEAFCEEYGYDQEDITEFSTPWIRDLEERVPA